MLLMILTLLQVLQGLSEALRRSQSNIPVEKLVEYLQVPPAVQRTAVMSTIVNCS
jgi:hypothetical protein